MRWGTENRPSSFAVDSPGWAADFADLLVEAANHEARDLDEEFFLRHTRRCTPLERDAIWAHLPLWVWRKIGRGSGEQPAP